jgi:hypothetical protein
MGNRHFRAKANRPKAWVLHPLFFGVGAHALPAVLVLTRKVLFIERA